MGQPSLQGLGQGPSKQYGHMGGPPALYTSEDPAGDPGTDVVAAMLLEQMLTQEIWAGARNKCREAECAWTGCLRHICIADLGWLPDGPRLQPGILWVGGKVLVKHDLRDRDCHDPHSNCSALLIWAPKWGEIYRRPSACSRPKLANANQQGRLLGRNPSCEMCLFMVLVFSVSAQEVLCLVCCQSECCRFLQ